MGFCAFKGASEKNFLSAENPVKTPTHLTFHNDFSHVVISKSDCDTIKNLRCSPVNGHNRITTYERTETRAGTGSGRWPVVDIIVGYRRFCRPRAGRTGCGQQQPVGMAGADCFGLSRSDCLRRTGSSFSQRRRCGAFCRHGLWFAPGARHRMVIFVGHSCRLACGIAYRRRIRSGDVWLA